MTAQSAPEPSLIEKLNAKKAHEMITLHTP